MSFAQLAWHNVLRNHRAYLAYFMASAFAVLVVFLFIANLFHPQLGSRFSSGPVRAILDAGAVALYGFSALFVAYSVGVFLRDRSREFGLLMLLGMTRAQIVRLVVLENLIIGVAAVALGIASGLLVLDAYLVIAGRVLELAALDWYFPRKAMLLTAAGFGVLFAAVAVVAPLAVISRRIIALLREARKPRPEPRTSPAIAALALALLLAGYALAFFTVEIPYEVYVIGLLVAAGTYLLYTQLGVYGLKRMKRHPIYLRGLNLLWISDLVHRVRDNARLLFIVTMVWAVALTAMAASYALSQTLRAEFEASFPFAFNYFSYGENVQEAQHLQAISQHLRGAGLEFRSGRTPMRVEGEGRRRNVVLPAGGYNELAEMLGRPAVVLGPAEAAWISPWVEKANTRRQDPRGPVSIGGVQLTITQAIYRNIFPEGTFAAVYVVDDRTFDQLAQALQPALFVGFSVPAWVHADEVAERIATIIPPGQAEYALREAPSWYRLERLIYRLIFFVCAFMSVVFFVAAGSFLYLRFYTDQEPDRARFRALRRIGLSDQQVSRTVTVELGLLFFAPYFVAALHSAFALNTLQGFVGAPLGGYTATVFALVLAAQIAYFAYLRRRHVRALLA